ncbi:MAG: glycosyltransferase [Bacteroidota bacterium]|nr:glycosyltransferase [Bacteroidota bacterium]
MKFIITSITPWDFPMGNNAKNIAEELSKKHQVLYVNPPLDRISAWKEHKSDAVKVRKGVLNNKIPHVQQVNQNLWVLNPPVIIESINWIQNKWLFRYLNKINNQKIANAIQMTCSEIGFDAYYIVNDSDMFRGFHLKEMLQPIKYMYYSRDNLMGVAYWKKHGLVMEPELIAKSDVAVANSMYLTDYLLQYNPNSFFVGQGCDLELFSKQQYSKPNELDSINGPIIGYTGALSSKRLDIHLLEEIVNCKPHWNFVFIGPEDDDFKSSKLHSFTNVYFLGNKPIAELPNYISHFDACINPQLVNEITIGNYPRKVDEYLAIGKPVIATYTKGMDLFSKVTYLGQGVEAFIQNIEKALFENNEVLISKRKAVANSHSWKNNVQQILNALLKGNGVKIRNNSSEPARI